MGKRISNFHFRFPFCCYIQKRNSNFHFRFSSVCFCCLCILPEPEDYGHVLSLTKNLQITNDVLLAGMRKQNDCVRKRRLTARSLYHMPLNSCGLLLRPHRSPRPLAGIICGIVYFPEAQAQENRDRESYLTETLHSVMSAHTDCGVIICGGFNALDFSDILIHDNLKQVVSDPTRGNSILDLIRTDLYNRFDKPVVSANAACVGFQSRLLMLCRRI